MRYVSTRGEAPALNFVDVTLAGLARDGGLYVPETWPTLSPDAIAALAGRPYAEVAVEVIAPFVGDAISRADLSRMAHEAYGTFRHPAVTPLVQIADNNFVLELSHGPTLAFKDLAMQLLARLMDHVLARRGERTTIVVATSGDTGGAAVEAFRDRAQADLIVLYPHGRVSDVQRRMMTTANAANVHALAVDGTFDDCQAIVKALFNHHAFRDRVRLSGVNSINFARIVAQVVYYFTVRGCARRAASQDRLHGPDRKFRRRVRRLCRAAHGTADRPADDRHQRQRHSGAHAGQRRLRVARRRADDVAVDGHSGVVEFRAAAVRRLWPRRCRRAHADGVAGAVEPLHHLRARRSRKSAGISPRTAPTSRKPPPPSAR